MKSTTLQKVGIGVAIVLVLIILAYFSGLRISLDLGTPVANSDRVETQNLAAAVDLGGGNSVDYSGGDVTYSYSGAAYGVNVSFGGHDFFLGVTINTNADNNSDNSGDTDYAGSAQSQQQQNDQNQGTPTDQSNGNQNATNPIPTDVTPTDVSPTNSEPTEDVTGGDEDNTDVNPGGGCGSTDGKDSASCIKQD